MSTQQSNTSPLVDVKEYIYRYKPDYEEDLASLAFSSVEQFHQWFKEVACCHGNWIVKTTYAPRRKHLLSGAKHLLSGAIALEEILSTTRYICDHSGVPSKKKIEADETATTTTEITATKRRRITKSSIKVGCTASILKKEFKSGAVAIVYKWKHINHDPVSMVDLAESRLPPALREWIVHHVKNHQDWRGIKALLRHSLEELDDIETNAGIKGIPGGLLIHYQLVKNVVHNLRCKDIKESIDKYQKQLNTLIESTSKKYENSPDNLEMLLINIKNYISQVDTLKNPSGNLNKQG